MSLRDEAIEHYRDDEQQRKDRNAASDKKREKQNYARWVENLKKLLPEKYHDQIVYAKTKMENGRVAFSVIVDGVRLASTGDRQGMGVAKYCPNCKVYYYAGFPCNLTSLGGWLVNSPEHLCPKPPPEEPSPPEPEEEEPQEEPQAEPDQPKPLHCPRDRELCGETGCAVWNSKGKQCAILSMTESLDWMAHWLEGIYDCVHTMRVI